MRETVERVMAAIDVGSNTIHLLVARCAVDGGALAPLADETEVVRLGEDVGATGVIGLERMRRALEAVAAQAARARELGAEVGLGLATEGVRAAANGAELLRRVEAEAGVRLHLLTGEQEAALTYWGVTGGVDEVDRRRAVIDLGGGSMELVLGQGARIAWRVSLPLGAGVLLARARLSDPPTEAELARVRELAETSLAAVTPPGTPEAIAIVIACGGATNLLYTLARVALGIAEDEAATADRAGLTGVVGALSREHLRELARLLGTLSAEEIMTRYGLRDPRVRLLAPGALALVAALDRLGAHRLLVSRQGIREGAIRAYLRHGADWLAAAESLG
jgi:exopolyphosphatase/guanosine-5'-triphosphate,3'-diphosphate pyrophosphatase